MKPITRVFDLLEGYREAYQDKENAFLIRSSSGWEALSSSEYLRLCRNLSLGMLSIGISTGTRVATVMLNGPEWIIVDMAILQIGAVHVPIYPTISEENYQYILSDSGAEYLFVSNRLIYRRINAILTEIPNIRGIFSIERVQGCSSWKELLNTGQEMTDTVQLERIREAISPDDLVSVIYTS